MSKYFPPVFNQESFSCPHCDVLAKQDWSHSSACYNNKGNLSFRLSRTDPVRSFSFALCSHCDNVSIWKQQILIYPDKAVTEEANPDLPDDILVDYNEAKEIFKKSPRSAAALLRLALQKLLVYVGESGKSINDDIKNLVKRGLTPEIQQALDAIRVVGNNAVHPGQIDLNNDPEVARTLFFLLNVICDHFITNPNKIARFYGTLPDRDRDIIAKRDGLTT